MLCEVQHNTPLPFVGAVSLQMAATKNPTNHLHSAAQYGYSNMVATILSVGTDINLGNESGSTPVYLASRWGHLRTTKLLLQQGADLHLTTDHGWAPLHAASIHGYLAISLVLLKAGADVNKAANDGVTPLIAAATGGHTPIAKALIYAGAHLDTQKPGNGESALYNAAWNGNLGVVRELFGAGANAAITTSEGLTPMEVATSNGHCQIVKEFVALGEERYGGSAVGVRALSIAAICDRVDILVVLRDAGIVDDRDGIAIISAARFDCRNAVRFLLEFCGSNASTYDCVDISALMYAAVHGDPRLAQLLLEAGADETTYQRGVGPMECTHGKLNASGMVLHAEVLEPGRMAVRRLLQQVPSVRAVSWLWSAHPTQDLQIASAIPTRLQVIRLQRRTIQTKLRDCHISTSAATMLRRVISWLKYHALLQRIILPQSAYGLGILTNYLFQR